MNCLGMFGMRARAHTHMHTYLVHILHIHMKDFIKRHYAVCAIYSETICIQWHIDHVSCPSPSAVSLRQRRFAPCALWHTWLMLLIAQCLRKDWFASGLSRDL